MAAIIRRAEFTINTWGTKKVSSNDFKFPNPQFCAPFDPQHFALIFYSPLYIELTPRLFHADTLPRSIWLLFFKLSWKNHKKHTSVSYRIILMSPVKETPKESTEVEMVPAAEELKKNEGIEVTKPENDKVDTKEAKESEQEEDAEEKEETTLEAGELLSARPTRERKLVKKFTVHASPKSIISKHLFIDKGRGEQLKDIPNVAYKLSKRKADETLLLLHTILYGKKAKVHMLKKNIGNFSGFVWIDSEGKQRGKLKEKIDKCTKEKLLDFCDILNIPVSKATVKKEELSVKLLEFLERPCATTDILLADKETGKKRKSNDPLGKSKSSGTSNLAGEKRTKKPKLDSESEKKRKRSTEEVDNDKSEPSQSEDNQDDDKKVSGTESDERGSDSEKETDEDLPKKEIVVKTSSSKKSVKKDTGGNSEKSKLVDKKIPAEASNASGKSTKDSTSSALKKCIGESVSTSKKKAPSTKKPETEKESKMDKSPPAMVKSPSKSSTKVLKTDQGESKKAKKEPTVEEMQAAVENVLKKVDFNTETLSDILKKLGEHFGLDVTHRKAEVRDIITEAIKDMSGGEETSEEDESEEEDDDA